MDSGAASFKDLEALRQAINKTLHERIFDVRERKLERKKINLDLNGVRQGTAILGIRTLQTVV